MRRVAAGLVLAGLLLSGARSAFAGAAEFEVTAAQPASVVWTVPLKAEAGEPFPIKLEVRDRYGNVVKDFDRRGTGFELRAVGRGELQPRTVSPESFIDGVAEIQAVYKVAERIEIMAKAAGPGASSQMERMGGLEFRSPPFFVTAGKLAELRIVAPISARSGTPFRVNLSAIDAYGNLVKDYKERTGGVILSSTGLGLLSPMRVVPAAFREGQAEVTLTYTGTGEITILAKDPGSDVTGRSGARVLVGPGEPVRFQVTAPPQAWVDHPFDVAITALDAFGNVVTDYDVVGTVVIIATDGSATLPNNQVAAAKFVKGVAFAKLAYSKAENISLIVSEPGTSRAGTSTPIAVQPGKPARFEVIAPPGAEAGKPFPVTVRVVDARGNLTKFDQPQILLFVQGSIVTTPIEIPVTALKNGETQRKLSYTLAEEITVTAQDGSNTLRSDPARVLIRPGPAQSVGLTAPTVVTAGAGIPVKLTILDEYRNVVHDFDKAGGIVVVRVEAPNAPAAVEAPAEMFSKGQTDVTVNYFQAGTARVSADFLGRRATSSPIEIVPAALHHFDAQLPAQARAGEAFQFTLNARDAFGNAVVDYDRTGQGVQIHSSGVSEVQPSFIPAAAFRQGAAQVQLISYAAEDISITVSERFGSATGNSGQIRISAGAIDHFLVSASPKIRAGEKFPLRIEAQDMYYNLIKSFSLPGAIRLATSGKGNVHPSQIDASRFSNGVAFVQATVTASGRMELVASTDDRKAVGRSNPVLVLPAAASSYRVDVLDAVTAGEPFRARITALDAFENPVEDLKGFRSPIRIFSGGSEDAVSPTILSPELFRDGKADAYLVVPRAGRVSLQVRELDGRGDLPEGISRIDDLFFKTYGYGGTRTDIYILASGPIEYRVADPARFGDGVDALVITFPNANLRRESNYDNLTLPGLKSAKLSAYTSSDIPAIPRLMLKIDSRYAYTVNARSNLLVLTLTPAGREIAPTLRAPSAGEPAAATIPSLDDIRAMINRSDYRSARRAVVLFLSAHPGHPEAMALRTRLEKVLKLTGE